MGLYLIENFCSKNIGVLLLWSPFGQLKASALIKLRIFMNIC